jgi:superfamily II DNA helicase RecQ
MQASYDTAQQWGGQGRTPFLQSGIVDPRFVDDVIQQAPTAARAFAVGQAKAGVTAGQGLNLADAVALGATTPAPGTITPPTGSSETAPASTTYDPVLYEQLRTWRREEADRQGKAAFHVFPDATLQRIAAARPQTEAELLAIKGVGAKKLASFGPAILAVLDVTRAQPPKGEAT